MATDGIDYRNITLGASGEIILSDEDLLALNDLPGLMMAGGEVNVVCGSTSNTACHNTSWCFGSSNTTCTNSEYCNSATNSTCQNDVEP